MVDIIFGGAYAIKNYYLESGNPTQMRGASQLLLDMFEKYIPDIIKNSYFDKSSYEAYFGGSQMFVVVRENKGEELIEKIERKFDETCQTASFSFISLTVDEEDINDSNKFPGIMDRLFALSNERRYLKLPSIVNQDAPDGNVKNHKYIHDLQKEFVSFRDDSKLCRRCRAREPHYEVNYGDEILYLCTSCAKKYRRGQPARNEFRAQSAKAIVPVELTYNASQERSDRKPQECSYRERSAEESAVLAEFKSDAFKLYAEYNIQSMDDIADEASSNVALLYADINNLGGIGSQMKTHRSRLALHKAVDEAIHEALYLTLWRTMRFDSRNKKREHTQTPQKLTSYFEIIACGGDDSCVLLPGDLALYAATGFANEFDRVWEEKTSNNDELPPLSISIGVAIADSKTGIDYFHHMTEQLLKSAKDFSYKKYDNKKSAIDLYRIGSEAQCATELSVLRDFGDDRHPLYMDTTDGSAPVDLSLFPMTTKEAEKFILVLKAADKMSGSFRQNIVNGAKRKSIPEATLYFDYQCSRITANPSKDKAEIESEAKVSNDSNDIDGKKAMNAMSSALSDFFSERANGQYPKMFYSIDGKNISPWQDILTFKTQEKGG
jgi:hypothetical protein